MDPVRFDRLTKSFSRTSTRRGLLRLLAAIPVAAGVVALLAPEDAAGQGNGAIIGGGGSKRRKTRHRHDPGKGKDTRKGKRKGKHKGKGKHTTPTPSNPTTPSTACGPFVTPCPGDPQCGTFGKPCPPNTQCVDGTCSGDSCPSASFPCLGSGGGECCAERSACCKCRNNVTNETYGFCSTDPACGSVDFGPDVVCGHV